MLLPWLCGCSELAEADKQSQPRTEQENQQPAEQVAPAASVQDDGPLVGYDWPRWRGPRLDGISKETGWKSQWTEPPKILWKASIGIGFSSFSVADGRVFTMGYIKKEAANEKEPAEEENKEEESEGKDWVYCFDAESGKPLWTHSYDCALVDNLHEGGPAATPTVDGKHVYTVSKQGHLFCLDVASGEVVWKREFAADFGVEMPIWGYACSPLVHGNLLIVDAGPTAAYNKLTGELVWQTDTYLAGYGSPVPMKHQGKDLIVVLNNQVLHVVHAADGAPIAKTKWDTDYYTTSTTPIIHNDTIFISTGYNRGCALFKLTGNKLENIYENKNMSNHMNNCVLIEGKLYGFNGNSHVARQVKLSCIDYQTGESHWEERGLGCGSLMAAAGKLILLSDSGELVIAQPSAKGFQPGSKVQILEGKCWTVPVLSHGRLYARNAAGDMVCVDLRK
jgi:outer membrane protein assembly factor BamB